MVCKVSKESVFPSREGTGLGSWLLVLDPVVLIQPCYRALKRRMIERERERLKTRSVTAARVRVQGRSEERELTTWIRMPIHQFE